MTLLESINSRRSIRRYTGEVIDEDSLRLILQAGFQAPSAHNHQSQNFIVIQDPEKLESIAQRHKYAKMLSNAGCGIVVCGDRRKQTRDGLLACDCSASIQNMLLAAHSLDLGAVWIGLYPIDSFVKMISDLLNLPEFMLPIGMIAVGYKAENKEVVDRFDPLRLFMDKWENL